MSKFIHQISSCYLPPPHNLPPGGPAHSAGPTPNPRKLCFWDILGRLFSIWGLPVGFCQVPNFQGLEFWASDAWPRILAQTRRGFNPSLPPRRPRTFRWAYPEIPGMSRRAPKVPALFRILSIFLHFKNHQKITFLKILPKTSKVGPLSAQTSILGSLLGSIFAQIFMKFLNFS